MCSSDLEKPGGTYKNVSVIGAIRQSGLVAMQTVKGPVSGAIFVDFLRRTLRKRLRQGDLLIMDNLRAHYHRFVRPLVESVDADVAYLPPYSPDLNPIELVWPVVKRQIRRSSARTVESLRKAIRAAWRNSAHLRFENLLATCQYG